MQIPYHSHSMVVASGDFNFAKRPFILGYGVRCNARVSWPLSLAIGNDTRTHSTSVLGENFSSTPLF